MGCVPIYEQLSTATFENINVGSGVMLVMYIQDNTWALRCVLCETVSDGGVLINSSTKSSGRLAKAVSKARQQDFCLTDSKVFHIDQLCKYLITIGSRLHHGL